MKYVTCFLTSMVFLACIVGKSLANENLDPQLDVSVAIVNSSNTGGSGNRVQYSAVIRNTGTDFIDEVSLRIYSDDANIELIHHYWPRSYFFDINNEIGPFTLDPNQTIHIPFFAYVRDNGSISSIHAEIISSDDEVVSNNRTSVALHTHEDHFPSLMQNDVVVVEAEKFRYQRDSTLASTAEAGYQIPTWHLHSEEFLSTKQPDPDSSSPADAGGGAYVEALPDVRLNEFDAPVFGISNFDQIDRGPELNYTVYLDQPGRYYLFARIRATNNQDNTVHVRFDDDDVATIDVCNPDGNWQWASQNAAQCNSIDSAYFEVENSGFYSVAMAMGDDGTEVDKIMLQRDNSTKPSGIGPDPIIYPGPFANLVMIFWPLPPNPRLTPGDTLTLNAEILENTASGETIENIFINFDIDPALLQSYTGYEFCGDVDDKVQCSIKDWPHYGPNHVDPGPLGITIGPLVSGELVVDAWLEADLLPHMLDDSFRTQTFIVTTGGVLSSAAAADKAESEGGGGGVLSGLIVLLSLLGLQYTMLRRRK